MKMKVVCIKINGYIFRLARFQSDTRESFQLQHRPRDLERFAGDIQLRDFGACTLTCIANVKANAYRFAGANFGGRQRSVSVFKTCVAQTVAERVNRGAR